MRYEKFRLKDSIHVELCGNCSKLLSAVEKVSDTCYACGSNLTLSGIQEVDPSDLRDSIASKLPGGSVFEQP